VRSDAKASSAGSTSGQGTSLGSIVRGAFAIRTTPVGTDGSGAGLSGIAPARLLTVLCLSLLAVFAALAPSALAAQTHLYTGTSFGPDGVGGTEGFVRVLSLAVDSANGDTYVYDGGAAKVYKFDSAGAPLNFSATGTNAIEVGGGGGGAEFEIALAPAGSPGGTAGDIYVATNGQAIHVYSAAGTEIAELGQGGETCGVATDPSGNFYAGVYDSTINKYTPSANPPLDTDKAAVGSASVGLCNVAADGLGNVYAANFSGQGLYKLEGIGDTTPAKLDDSARTMAIAPGSNDLYADREDQIAQYSSSGTLIGSFGNGEINESRGVAVNADATKIYVGTREQVKVFGPTVLTPDATTGNATDVTSSSAVLHGSINAIGGPSATCEFEYVRESSFQESGFASAQTAPCEPAGPFSGSSTESVSAAVTGLNPAAHYAFRLVATSSNGSTRGFAVTFATLPGPFPPEAAIGPCSNDSLRSGHGARLPDCRAYEQATPVDKAGLSVEGLAGILKAAPDGSSVQSYSQAGSGIPITGGGRQEFTTLLSRRDGESWSTKSLLPPEQIGDRAAFLGTSENMRFALVNVGKRLETGNETGLALLDTSTDSVTMVVPFRAGGGLGSYSYDAISEDGSRVFFETSIALTPEAKPGWGNLYVWDRASGTVSVAGILPAAEGGKAPNNGSFGGAYSWFLEGQETYRGGSRAGLYVEAIHAASPSGDQIYFTAGGTGQLYLRRGFDSATPTTVRVSQPNEGVEDPYAEETGEVPPGAFQEATPDGSRAFFLSSQHLTEDATTGEFDEGKDLYRYDESSGELVDIAPDPAEPNGARVQGLLGASTDGSSGYFAAKGALAPGATAGNYNLYHFEESGGGFDLTFVTVLASSSNSGADPRNWSPQPNGGELLEAESLFQKSSRVTPDGKVLIFTSTRPISGYDNSGRGCREEGKCAQIYRYSAETDEVTCISCNPTGDQPWGAAELTNGHLNAHLISSAPVASDLTRNLSPDGSRVFFQTPTSLVEADTNAEGGCTYINEIQSAEPRCKDAYEWEAAGTPGGSCTEAVVNGGCLYLLTTGKSNDPSYFIDASADGDSVFLATTSQLVPSDHDGLFDIYDARVDGGLAAQQAMAPAPCASRESCRGPAAEAPAATSPGTASFQGSGNDKHPKSKQRKCRKSAKKCKKHKKAKKQNHKQKKQGQARPSKGGRK
jgi:hypothetical protein